MYTLEIYIAHATKDKIFMLFWNHRPLPFEWLRASRKVKSFRSCLLTMSSFNNFTSSCFLSSLIFRSQRQTAPTPILIGEGNSRRLCVHVHVRMCIRTLVGIPAISWARITSQPVATARYRARLELPTRYWYARSQEETLRARPDADMSQNSFATKLDTDVPKRLFPF